MATGQLIIKTVNNQVIPVLSNLSCHCELQEKDVTSFWTGNGTMTSHDPSQLLGENKGNKKKKG